MDMLSRCWDPAVVAIDSRKEMDPQQSQSKLLSCLQESGFNPGYWWVPDNAFDSIKSGESEIPTLDLTLIHMGSEGQGLNPLPQNADLVFSRVLFAFHFV
jgi:hypothetical protein